MCRLCEATTKLCSKMIESDLRLILGARIVESIRLVAQLIAPVQNPITLIGLDD